MAALDKEYQLVVDYAQANNITLGEGYRVWILDAGFARPSCHHITKICAFPSEAEAVEFGESHSQKARVMITGPENGQRFEIPNDRLQKLCL